MNIKEFFSIGEFFSYFIRKKDPSRPKNFSLKMMHGVNKLAMLMFVIALIIIVVRTIYRSLGH